jgi:hypothetical protein
VVSPLATVVEGMAVRTTPDGEAPSEPPGALAEEADPAPPEATVSAETATP